MDSGDQFVNSWTIVEHEKAEIARLSMTWASSGTAPTAASLLRHAQADDPERGSSAAISERVRAGRVLRRTDAVLEAAQPSLDVTQSIGVAAFAPR